MIQIKNLKKVYISQEIETTALININLEIFKGEFIAIMGPSGCGKTTLLNILGLLDHASAGEFYFFNQEISSFSENERAKLRKGNIGFVFQNFNLIDELTVYDNIELPLLYLGIQSKERKNLVYEMLEKMQIAHRKEHFPMQLSGGQQQRVAIARSVITKPKLILADEPTGNLDSVNGDEIMKLLTNLNDLGTTIIMVTHSAAYAAYSHRVIHLFDGHIVTENIKEIHSAHA